MKKLSLCVILLCLCLTLGAYAQSDVPLMGRIELLPIEQAALDASLADESSPEADLPWQGFSSLQDMLLSLNSGRIDYMMLQREVAHYISQRDPSLSMVLVGKDTYLTMAVMPDQTELRDRLNDALAAVMDFEKPTYHNLAEYWIDGKTEGKDTSEWEIETKDGRETLRIGVTGDLPPFDYVDESGNPAGFNVSVAALLGRYLDVNVELVSVAAPARLSALASGRIDVVYWLESRISDLNTLTDGTILTTNAYFHDDLALVVKDYPLDDIIKLYDLSQPSVVVENEAKSHGTEFDMTFSGEGAVHIVSETIDPDSGHTLWTIEGDKAGDVTILLLVGDPGEPPHNSMRFLFYVSEDLSITPVDIRWNDAI